MPARESSSKPNAHQEPLKPASSRRCDNGLARVPQQRRDIMWHTKRAQLAPALAILATLLVSVTAVTVAAAGSPSDTPEAERLRATELERLRALIDADMAVVERLHADDFQLVPPP